MMTKNIALTSSAAVILAFATFAWADSTTAPEAEAAASAEASEEAPARLCIPKAEAEAAAEAADDEAKAEEGMPSDSDGNAPVEGEAEEAALPICDDEGNPPEPAEAEEAEEETKSES